MKRCLLIGLMFFGIFLAQAKHPLVRNFTRDLYKAGTQNWSVAQNQSDVMYFANNAGLLEFDGKDWATYPIRNGTNVRSVMVTGDGRCYVSSFKEFGYFTKQLNGDMVYTSLVDQAGLVPDNSNELYHIIQGDKTIYFQTERCVYAYRGNRVTRIPFNGKIDAAAFVHGILFVTDERSGVHMLHGSMFVRVPDAEILLNKKVCAILPLGAENVLFVTSLDGVYVYDGVQMLPYRTGIDEFLRSSQVFCAAANERYLVYGTVQRGIAIQDLKDASVQYLNTYTGLQNNTVLSMLFDRDQNLWLGLDKGIDYVLLNSPFLNLFGDNNLYGAGYTSLLKGSTLYLGTNQGLYQTRFPLKEGPMPVSLSLVKGMEGQVWDLVEIDHTLFCGDDQGAFILHDQRPERIQGLPGTWSFISLKRHPDLILGCSYQGLFLLKKVGATWKLHRTVKGKFAESSPMFLEDDDGTIWFSHWQKGIFHLKFNTAMDSIVRVDLYNGSHGLPSDRNNTVFRVGQELVFSTVAGFYSFDHRTKKMLPCAKWNRLFASLPNSVRLHEALNGDVWCVSGSFIGLARKTPQGFRMDSLTHRMMQPKIIIGFEHFNFLDQHHTLMGNEDGFTWLDNRRKTERSNSFKVMVRKVQVTSEGNASTVGTVRHDKTDGDLYSHQQNSLRFEFVAPEYRNEGQVRYQFKLEGYDEAWSSYSTESQKEYTHLPKGHYTFRVRAWNELESAVAEQSYRFVVEPAWYEGKLAWTIYALLLIGAAFGLYFLVKHRYRKGARDMELMKEKELLEQKEHFDAENMQKKNEIKELKRQQLQYELRHKSQELASSTMNLIRKNEMMTEIIENLTKVTVEIQSSVEPSVVLSRIHRMERSIRQNIEQDDNWKRFEVNFDLVYEHYMKRLGEQYPELTVSDKKLCAYLKMDLSSKDIAALSNISVRSVEMSRYRLRQKMGLDREVNLSEYLQKF